MSEADLITTVPANIFTADPVTVLTKVEDGKLVAYDDLLTLIRRETDAFEPDLSSEASRKKIASLAFKVTRTKTAIDGARKDLTAEARKRISDVNAIGNKIVAELDEIAKSVRAPLTQWEQAEADRVKQVEDTLAALRAIRAPEEEAAIAAAIEETAALTFDPDVFRESLSEAKAAQKVALDMLRDVHAKAVRVEEERVELERLRAEAAERERVEREAAERAAKEKAEAEQRARAEEEARRREAEAAAQARAEEKRRADAEIAEANRRASEASEAEAAAKAERERIAAEARREAEEQAARERDKAHRAAVLREAKEALMGCGPDEATAKTIVKAIVNGSIPHVSLRF